MTVKDKVIKVVLSDEEDRIVEIYKREHNKENTEEAIKEIIKTYKPLCDYWDKTKSWWKKYQI